MHALNLAMVRAPEFGRLGWMTVILGVAGALSSVFSLFVFETIWFMFLSDLVFLIVVGRRVHGMSKSQRSETYLT